MNSYMREISDKGFLLIRNVLSNSDVDKLIVGSREIKNKTGDETLCPSDFLKEINLSGILFSNDIKNAISEIFGCRSNVYMYPNFTIRNGLYINWHTDDLFLKEPIEMLNDLPTFYMFNIYLQNNSLEQGGGLDVQMGTQRLPKAKRHLLMQNDNTSKNNIIVSNAGDLIVFDYRVVHRGTVPEAEKLVERMALQWTMSTSDKYAKIYMSYLKERASKKIHISDFTKHRAQNFFKDLPNITSDTLLQKCPAFFDEYIHFCDMSHYFEG